MPCCRRMDVLATVCTHRCRQLSPHAHSTVVLQPLLMPPCSAPVLRPLYLPHAGCIETVPVDEVPKDLVDLSAAAFIGANVGPYTPWLSGCRGYSARPMEACKEEETDGTESWELDIAVRCTNGSWDNGASALLLHATATRDAAGNVTVLSSDLVGCWWGAPAAWAELRGRRRTRGWRRQAAVHLHCDNGGTPRGLPRSAPAASSAAATASCPHLSTGRGDCAERGGGRRLPARRRQLHRRLLALVGLMFDDMWPWCFELMCAWLSEALGGIKSSSPARPAGSPMAP